MFKEWDNFHFDIFLNGLLFQNVVPFVYWFTTCLSIYTSLPQAHSTHETESPQPVHFKPSDWWKRRTWYKVTSHYTWGTNGVCGCKMDVKSTWTPTWHRMDHVSWSLGSFSKTIFLEVGLTGNQDHGIPNAHNHWFIWFYHVWGLEWIKFHWNSIWLGAWSEKRRE